VLTPPVSNLILIDCGGSAQSLRTGVKPADELLRTVAPYQQ
jgi:hypothetical protein